MRRRLLWSSVALAVFLSCCYGVQRYRHRTVEITENDGNVLKVDASTIEKQEKLVLDVFFAPHEEEGMYSCTYRCYDYGCDYGYYMGKYQYHCGYHWRNCDGKRYKKYRVQPYLYRLRYTFSDGKTVETMEYRDNEYTLLNQGSCDD